MTYTFKLRDAQVQQWRHDRRRRPRLRLEALSSTRARPRTTRRSSGTSSAAGQLIDHDRQEPALGCRHRGGRQKRRRLGPGRQDVRRQARPTRPATSSTRRPLGARRRSRRSGSRPRTSPRRANYVSSGPFMMKRGTTRPRSSSCRTRTGTATKPTLTEIRYSRSVATRPPTRPSFEAGELDMLERQPARRAAHQGRSPTLGPLVQTEPSLIFDYWGFDSSRRLQGQPHRSANRQALPSRAVDGDRQGHHAGDRLRRPGPRRR